MIGAILLGIVAALIELPLPAEDGFRTARAHLRSHDAPDNIVVVAIDDATLGELATSDPNRMQDVVVIDRLFDAGIDKLVFDRAYADLTNERADAALSTAFARHEGRVWLGAAPPGDEGLYERPAIIPNPRFRSHTQMAAMTAHFSPFSLSVRIPTERDLADQSMPAISAVLAGYDGPAIDYRPDFAINPNTIPTISYSDIIAGRAKLKLDGKTAIISATHSQSGDLFRIPTVGTVPGVYLHVMGAHTLRNGVPLDLSWYPAMLVVCAALAAQALRKRPSLALTSATAAILIAGPMLLDHAGIAVEIFPAMIAFAIGTLRLARLANRNFSRSTQLMLPEALKSTHDVHPSAVYALKITNLADFPASSIPHELGSFMERLVKTLQTSGTIDTANYAFENDTLIWQAPLVTKEATIDNARGLQSILRASSAAIGAPRIESAIGIDTNCTLPLAVRLRHAVDASDTAFQKQDRIALVDGSWLSSKERRLVLLAELDRGMEDGIIALGYQPKVDLASGRIVGAEALLRWEHPELGYIDPSEIVAVAEQHDRITPLTAYVLDRAMKESRSATSWDGSFTLAVNISPFTLANIMILYHVSALRNRHDFLGSNLVLEVTETAPLETEEVRSKMEALAKDGITFSIDDFGTGHSNIETLRNIQSAEIKIDRSFVADMLTSPSSEAVVRSTIEMAHAMGKIVVAEGVETQDIADRLRELKCDLAQGYLYAPAVPFAELTELKKKEKIAA